MAGQFEQEIKELRDSRVFARKEVPGNAWHGVWPGQSDEWYVSGHEALVSENREKVNGWLA